MSKRKLLLSIIAVLIYGCVNAQKYTDLISVSEQYSLANGYKFGNEKCDVHDQTFAAKAPLKINSKDYLLVGFSANHLQFVGNIFPGGSSFTALTMQLGYIGNFGRYNLTAVALPKISGDFAEITHRDFQMGGLLVLSVKYTDKLKLKYGCYYNQEFFGPLIVPIIGLDWKVNEKLRVFGNLPITATAEYEISNRFSAGLFFNANSMSYLYDKPQQYIHKTTQEISAFGDVYFTKNMVLQTKFGYTIGRKYDLFNLSDKLDANLIVKIGDHRPQMNNNSLNNGFIGELKLIFRVPNQ